MTTVDIEKVMDLILKDADNKKETAAYNGSMNDDGASRLKEQVSFYKAGRQGVIPLEWSKYAEESKKISDPEYSEYIRLKNKFK